MSAKVTLLAYTPMPEKTVAMAAKLCYSKTDIDKIEEGLTEEKTAAFLDMLSSLGHQSPIEHASFTFGIEGISRACSHQLVRHRIASYSQQSQRYVDGTSFEFVTPPKIEQSPELSALYNKALETEMTAYRTLRDGLMAAEIRSRLGDDAPNDMSDSEIIEYFRARDKKACSAIEKSANEDARFILPNACTTKIICTFNARSLLNFFEHRCCNRAQWEIRDVANQMLVLVKEVAPHIFANAGPGCVRGACPEGAMSCGKASEMRTKYKAVK
ncbi:MAG: FAD-dependent thymidylate synthase [Clostridia bacterium]|nr:FAD-dependent thymidylate synthase [Clostridia bacterium]